MRRSDITNEMIVLAIAINDARPKGVTYSSPFYSLLESTKAPTKVLWRAWERAEGVGLIEMCSIPTGAWLTEKGEEFLLTLKERPPNYKFQRLK